MTAVVWTSPLGLPVVQPYRKEVKKQIMTSLQTVYISDPNVQSEVSPQKQATAFPPNYIHSLDATHMLLTAGACYNKEITFASVHDSYWTHAATVESMSENIRDTFIHLHSGDLINRLHDEFLERYGKHYIPINSGSKLLADAKKQRKATKARTQAKAKAAAAAESAESAELADADAEDADSLGSEEGLNLEELSGDIPIHTVGNQRFVRFSDVLPPTPPRGQFDVQRIRDSQYFFS
jgi:DNA-directed RNA polymerase